MKGQALVISLLSGAITAVLATELLRGPAPAGSHMTPVERGRYLVDAAGCADCHTPWQHGPDGPMPDESRSLSGHPAEQILVAPSLPGEPWEMVASSSHTAWAGPWGVSFTANLTPDPDTGLGRWSEQDFVDTIRSGRRLGRGRHLLPPMPWFAYATMNDDDLRAIFAYLRTLQPIANRVPDPIPPATTR
jgi:mono/diheme cytochrome c family protein